LERSTKNEAVLSPSLRSWLKAALFWDSGSLSSFTPSSHVSLSWSFDDEVEEEEAVAAWRGAVAVVAVELDTVDTVGAAVDVVAEVVVVGGVAWALA